MIETVTNTKLNNIEEMLSNKTLKAENIAASGIDKKTSKFDNILDKTINKEIDRGVEKEASKIDTNMQKGVEENTDTKAEVQQLDINEYKTTKELQIKEEDWAEFKSILTEITNEANVESSLDLTLAKDITEIINQLKDAVENTENITKDNFDGEIVETEINWSDDENIISDEIVQDEIKNENEKNSEEFDGNFEKLVALLNSKFDNNSVDKVALDKTQVSVIKELSENDTVNLEQSEIIEFSENITDEAVSVKQFENAGDNTSEITIDEELIKDLKIKSIKSEVETSADESFMQNQTPEEHAVKAIINQDFETFDLKIEQAVNSNNQSQAQAQIQPKTLEANPSRIIDQITKHLENLQNNSRVSIVLNPEALGKVDIQLLTTKEGLSAQFTVATQEARDLLMKGLDNLKETLTAQGVGVDNVSVKLSESEKSEYKQDWTEQENSGNGKQRQEQSNREEKEKGLFEKLMAQSNEEENGNV